MEQHYMLPILYCQYHSTVDTQPTLGTRASAGMVLISKAGIFSVSSIRRLKTTNPNLNKEDMVYFRQTR